MYRMIIVDDEKLIRTGLESYLDWNEMNIEIIGTYADGKEALDTIRLNSPDIVLADISMPVMNGIELLKQTRLEGFQTEFIFISAYSEFRFAQDAVKYGAFDYLLKPIEDHVLKDCILRCIRQIDSKKPSEKGKLELPLVNNLFYGALNGSPGTDEALKSLLLQNGIPQDTLLLAAEPGKAESVLSDIPIHAILQPDCTVALFDAENQYRPKDIPTNAISGNIHASLCRLLLQQWIEKHQHRTGETDSESEEQWLKRILNLAEEAIKHDGANLANLTAQCAELLNSLIPDNEKSNGRTREQASGIQNIHSMQKRTEHAYGLLDYTYSEGLNILAQYSEGTISPYTRKAVALIQERYSQPISLSTVAKELHISSSHLSVTFKNDTGVAFSDYLFEKRMATAKDLLRSSDARVYEVAQAVGYPDLAQFSKRFKQYYHISPSVMQRLLADQDQSKD